MVVVVQLFTGNDDAPRGNIGAGVWRLKVTVAPEVRSPIDDAGRRNRRPCHLHGPYRQAGHAKQCQVEDHHQTYALPRVTGVDIAFNPIVRGAVAEARHGIQVFGFSTIQLSPLQQHGFDAVNVGAVGVICLLTFGVVLAVNGGPFLSHLARRQPQPKTEEVRSNGVQIQGTVRLVAVQKHGHADHGDVGHCQGKQHYLPPRQIPRAIG